MTHMNLTLNGGIHMKKGKIKVFKRLLVATLVFAFAVGGLTLTSFASTAMEFPLESEANMTTGIENDEIVIFDADADEVANEIVPYSFGVTSIPENMAVQSPYKYCCVISSHFPNGDVRQCSGILLGKDVVLTSAHGIYDNERGGNATSVSVAVGAYFNSSGTFITPNGVTTRKQYIMLQSWINDQKGTSD